MEVHINPILVWFKNVSNEYYGETLFPSELIRLKLHIFKCIIIFHNSIY
jgi:hypothetical protein